MADNRIAEAFVEVRYGFDKLRSDLTQATGTIDRQLASVEQTTRGRFTKIASAIGAPFAAVSRSLRSVQGQIATLGSTLATALVARSVINTNIEFEKLQGSLETVTGSAAAGQAAFAALTKFAQQTPFALEESVTAFVRLRSLGIQPTEERLKSFGNTASAFGKSLTQFIEATADASTGEFERLKEFGIRAKQQGDEVAFTFQGVTTTVGKNSAEIVAYLETIGNVNFASAMADQMNRLPGLVSNLGDVFSGLARAIGTGGLNDGMKALARTMIDVAEETEGIAVEIGKLIGGALQTLADGIRAVTGYFKSLSPEMQAFAVKLAATGAALATALPLLALFVAGVGALLSPLGLAVTALAAATAGIVAFSDQTFEVGERTVRVGGVINAVWVTIVRSIQEAVAATGHMLTALGRLVTLDFSGAAQGLREARDEMASYGEDIAQAWADAFVQAEDQINETFARIRPVARPPRVPTDTNDNTGAGGAVLPPLVPAALPLGDAIRDATRYRGAVVNLGEAGEETADHMATLRATVAQLGAQLQGTAATTRDFFLGFAQGMAEYALEAGNMYEQAAQLGKRAMKGLEDALVEFATTGKLEVKEMVASILADLSRLAIQQGLSSAIGTLLPIATAALGNYFGGGATGTTGTTGASAGGANQYKPFGFAMGGTFKVGGGGGIDSQLVQFRATPGEIVDVHRGEGSIRARSGGGVSVTLNAPIDARGAEPGVEQRIMAAMERTVELAKAAVRDEATRSARYGGAFG
jgi:hypothetical protein